MTDTDFGHTLAAQIPAWAAELGFAEVGIADTNLSAEHPRVKAWLERRYHGDMMWLEQNLAKRLQPELLHPGTLRVISARMNYAAVTTGDIAVLKNPSKAYVSRYALGRDYHKLVRKRLAKLGLRISAFAQAHAPSLRAFVDSAPVLERPLAAKAGLGWVGKHSLLLNRDGSWFFLGELLTNLPLPVNQQTVANACGSCDACLKVCPTDAFPKPYVLDARRCISYLTIEYEGVIPEEFREVMGNRVFGCDDCQAICPWNKFAKATDENDFKPRHGLDDSELLALFNWDEATFLQRTEGSPLRRIGYDLWLRNLAIGLGNAPADEAIIAALYARRSTVPELVGVHIDWALARQLKPTRSRRRKLKNTTIDP